MKIKPFQLERYFAKYEFSAPYLLSSSDCEALGLQELLEMGNARTRELWNNLKLSYTESPGHPLLQKEIVELCRKNGLILFSDEMYRFLEYDETERLPSASDLYENAVSLFGLSKSFALPGLRIGWLVSKNKKLMEDIAGFKDYTTICNNAPGEILAIMVLQNRKNIVSRNLNLISRNLDILDEFFENYKNIFEWNRPKAGPIAFPGWKGRSDVNSFCRKLVNEKGVMLLPSGVYNLKGDNFRIGFARKNMPQSLEKLSEFINENQQL